MAWGFSVGPFSTVSREVVGFWRGDKGVSLGCGDSLLFCLKGYGMDLALIHYPGMGSSLIVGDGVFILLYGPRRAQ